MRNVRLALAISVLLAWGGPATAQPADQEACSPPLEMPSTSLRPEPIGPAPALPGCVNPQTHLASNCGKSEVEHYNTAVSAYNAKVGVRNEATKHYVDLLNAWGASVNTYAKCETQRINAGAPHH